MTDRQRDVNFPADGIDAALASFIADVLELAGLFRGVAQDIAREEGQTQARWYALSAFSQGPLTVSQAARRLGTVRQALQRVSNELLAEGLVRTERNPDHRSSPFMMLTPHGEEVLSRVSQAAMRSRRRWFADRDAPALQQAHAEIKRLRDALRDVTHAAQRPPA